jgi:hypothetical protein
MSTLLFVVLGVVAASMAVTALHHTKRVHNSLASMASKTQFPKALGMLILVAHTTEIARVLEHVSLPHVIAALLLFTLWAATHLGTADELL